MMKPTNARWTVLAYFAGEKDLAEAMVLSLKDMYRVGVGSRCNLVAQFNRVGSAPRRFTLTDEKSATSDAPSSRTTRLDRDGRLAGLSTAVSAEPWPRPSLPDVEPPQADVNRAALESFVTDAIRENPSEHYLLVLSGHGSGVVGRNAGQSGFSPGPMRTLDLGPMFRSIERRTGRVIDVLGIDACFMSMCEVCWDLRGAVRFLVASEGLVPQFGWPYHRILELFRDNPAASPEEVARAIVSRYLRYRADFDLAGQSVDLAACEVDRAHGLAEAVSELRHTMVTRLEDPVFRDALVLSHWRAQSYKSEQYVDLWDFCDLLAERSRDDVVRRACRRVKDSLSSPEHGIVRKSIFNGPAYQHSRGLSIYFPWSAVSSEYAAVGFAQATGWQRFLIEYVVATRREMRLQAGSTQTA